MKAQRVMFVSQGKVAVEEAELPAPGPGQVVVKAIASVVSPGTELAYLHQLENARWPLPGFNNGYCFCGTVTALGQDVKDLAIGQTVVTPTGHASAAVVDAKMCFPAPAGLPPEEAASFMLGAISLQGVRKGEVRLGLSVGVVGLGIVGNLAGQLSRAAGATVVVGIDPFAPRREIARQCGFDDVADSDKTVPLSKFPQLERSKGFDVVIEATGRPEPITTAFKLARRMGCVVLLATTRGNTKDVDFANDVHRKGLTVVGAQNGIRPVTDDIGTLFTLATDIRVTLDLLAQRRLQTKPLISGVVPWQQAPTAYARLAAKNEPVLTIAIDWRSA